jgi:magnesium and cobalt transporter
MRASRFTFALVTDEHGGVEGVVTTKDLLKELVGEIQDEYDPEEPSALPVGEGEWLVDGRISVEDLSEQLHTEFPTGEYTTFAGLVLDLAGRIPQTGDSVHIDGFVAEVVAMDRNRVDRIRLRRTTTEH